MCITTIFLTNLHYHLLNLKNSQNYVGVTLILFEGGVLQRIQRHPNDLSKLYIQQIFD